MTTEIEPPSKKQLLATSGIAAAIAVLVLFVAVLPAEYNIDPLRTGKLLGLTNDDVPPALAHSVSGDPIAWHNFSVTLQPNSGWTEDCLKVWLDEGESFQYSWNSTGPLTLDLHTDSGGSYPNQAPEGATSGEGFLTAPADGFHGWAIKNDSSESITFNLSLQGHFETEFDLYRCN